MFLNTNGKKKTPIDIEFRTFQCVPFLGTQSIKDRKEQLKRYLLDKESESILREKQFIDNQQQISDSQLKSIETYHKQRIQMLEREFLVARQDLLKTKEQALWEIDEHELRSRYDLLRKQTKSFYLLFRTMLTQQSEKELQQLDEQIRFERDTLDARLADDRREWPRTWKKMQKTRHKQFRQQLIINKTPFEEEKILIKKVKKRKRDESFYRFDFVFSLKAMKMNDVDFKKND